MADVRRTISGEADLLVDGLTVSYGAALAVDDISLAVAKGSISSVIGANGAGKSTLLRAIVGAVPVGSGSISFRGEELSRRSTNEIIELGLSLVPEGRRLFGDMTVLENLELGAYRNRRNKSDAGDLDQVFSYFPILKDKTHARAKHLSGGQQQMLAIGRALMSRPQMLMLDEPCAGLAPVMVKQIAGLFRQICDDGVTVLLVEQNAVVALDVSDYCYVLETGKVALHGPSAELVSTKYVSEAYLGI